MVLQLLFERRSYNLAAVKSLAFCQLSSQENGLRLFMISDVGERISAQPLRCCRGSIPSRAPARGSEYLTELLHGCTKCSIPV